MEGLMDELYFFLYIIISPLLIEENKEYIEHSLLEHGNCSPYLVKWWKPFMRKICPRWAGFYIDDDILEKVADILAIYNLSYVLTI